MGKKNRTRREDSVPLFRLVNGRCQCTKLDGPESYRPVKDTFLSEQGGGHFTLMPFTPPGLSQMTLIGK